MLPIIVKPTALTSIFPGWQIPLGVDIWSCIDKGVFAPTIPDVTSYLYTDSSTGVPILDISDPGPIERPLDTRQVKSIEIWAYAQTTPLALGTITFTILQDDGGYICFTIQNLTDSWAWYSLKIAPGTLDPNGFLTPPL